MKSERFQYVMRAKRKKSARLEDLKDPSKLEKAAVEIATRLQMVAANGPKDATPAELLERSNRLLKSVLTELGKVNATARDMAQSLPCEPFHFAGNSITEEKWSTCVLEPRFIERYGDRPCEACGGHIEPLERVAYVRARSAGIRHERCHEGITAPKTRGTWTEFALDPVTHARYIGVRCAGCGEPLEAGETVAWRPGSRRSWHAICKPE